MISRLISSAARLLDSGPPGDTHAPAKECQELSKIRRAPGQDVAWTAHTETLLSPRPRLDATLFYRYQYRTFARPQGPTMAHVFISYSSHDVELAKQLAAFLESCGLDVWWDRDLIARGPFAPQIHDKLRAAGAVVVLWTRTAISSAWVKLEADYALSKDMLVNVVARDVAQRDVPPPFNTHERHRPYDTDLILRDVLAVREGRLLLDDQQWPLPRADASTPALLLQAKYGLLPFHDDDGLKSNLIDWAIGRGAYAGTARPAAGRLIYGPGGVGKTRLLIEVAAAMRAEGWSAGFLTRTDTTNLQEKHAYPFRSGRRHLI